MKSLKSIISFSALMLLSLLVCVSAFAATPASSADSNVFSIFGDTSKCATTSSDGKEMTYVITDPAVIAQMSDSEVLPDRVELTYVPMEKSSALVSESLTAMSGDASITRLFETYEVRNVSDQGNGWYDSSHLLYEFYVDGPDTFTINKTATRKTETNCGLSGTKNMIGASVGFTIGQSRSLSVESNTPVPKGQRLRVSIYATHHKVTFDIFQKVSGNWVDKGSYEALEPNGVFFQKEFWKV